MSESTDSSESPVASGTDETTQVDQLFVTVAITGDRPSKFADLVSIAQDLQFALDCLSRLHEQLLNPESKSDPVLQQAYFTSAQLAYARCFGSGMRKTLDPQLIFGGLEGDPMAVHQQQIDMRNKRLAHSVNAFERVTIGAILPAERSPESEVVGIAALGMSHISYDVEGVRMFHALASVALHYVIEVCRTAEVAALQHAREIPVESLYESGSLRMYAPGPDEAGRPRASL